MSMPQHLEAAGLLIFQEKNKLAGGGGEHLRINPLATVMVQLDTQRENPSYVLMLR